MYYIHITGPSGSGKSSLITQLKRSAYAARFEIIDEDAIDDKHALAMLNVKHNQELIKKCKMQEIGYARQKMNKNWIDRRLALPSTQRKLVIFIGLSFRGLADPALIAQSKYCLAIDAKNPRKNAEIIYRRITQRTLQDLHANFAALSKLIASDVHPEIIKYRAIYEYEIRHDIIEPFCPFMENLGKYYDYEKKHGYRIIDANTIIAQIDKLAAKLFPQ